MFCVHCGQPLQSGMRFCGGCGAAIGGALSPDASAGPAAPIGQMAAAPVAASAARAGMGVVAKLVIALTLTVVVAGVGFVALPGPKRSCETFISQINRGDLNAAMEQCDPQAQTAYKTAKKAADAVVGLVGKVVGVDVPIGVTDAIDNMPLITQLGKELGAGSFSGEFVGPVTERVSGEYAIVYGEFRTTASAKDFATGETDSAQQTTTMLFPLKRYGLQWKIVLADPEALKGIQAAFPSEMERYAGATTAAE